MVKATVMVAVMVMVKVMVMVMVMVSRWQASLSLESRVEGGVSDHDKSPPSPPR
jgi:hypothetical protein